MKRVIKQEALILLFFLSVLLLSIQLLPNIQHILLLILPTEFLQLFTQPWRLVTGHFVHYSWSHLAINLATLIMAIWVFARQINMARACLFILFSSVFISFGLWIFSQLDIYYGFSGVLYGFIIWSLLKDFSQSPKIYSAAVVLIIIKVISDLVIGGPMVEQLIGLPVSRNAHWLGVASGFIFWIMNLLTNTTRNY